MNTGILITGSATIVMGLAVLLYGWRLYWLFVALGGFLFGVALTTTALATWNMIVVLVLAVVIGVAMGALAMVLRRAGAPKRV